VEPRVKQRLKDIVDAVNNIESLLTGKTFDDLNRNRHVRAAFERYIEILSEASQHVPDEVKAKSPHIPWPKVADIGNHIRHAYHRVDAQVFWTTFERGDLKEVKTACLIYIRDAEAN
jgi:uncharacterized protein with HEPN domain